MPLNDFRSVFMPYCIKKQPNGKYAVLNREYKPVGFYTRDHIEYSNFPVEVNLKGLTKIKAKKLSWEESENIDEIFFYNDGCVPTHSAQHMKAYLKKLEILAKLEIKS